MDGCMDVRCIQRSSAVPVCEEGVGARRKPREDDRQECNSHNNTPSARTLSRRCNTPEQCSTSIHPSIPPSPPLPPSPGVTPPLGRPSADGETHPTVRLSPVDEALGAPAPKRLTTKGQGPSLPRPPWARPYAAQQPQRSSNCFHNKVHNTRPRALKSDTLLDGGPKPR